MGYIDSINDFINSQSWIFAKTMEDIPHWYCLKVLCESDCAWDWFVRFMDQYGVEGRFCGKTYKYLYWGDYRYWMMDKTPEECNLINRCLIPDGEKKPENFPKILLNSMS